MFQLIYAEHLDGTWAYETRIFSFQINTNRYDFPSVFDVFETCVCVDDWSPARVRESETYKFLERVVADP